MLCVPGSIGAIGCARRIIIAQEALALAAHSVHALDADRKSDGRKSKKTSKQHGGEYWAEEPH